MLYAVVGFSAAALVVGFLVGALTERRTPEHTRALKERAEFRGLLEDCYPVMAERYGENVPPKGYVPPQPNPFWVRATSDALGYSGCAAAKSSEPVFPKSTETGEG